MMKISLLVSIILFLILVPAAMAEDLVPDGIQANISNPVLVANGVDSTQILITVLNQSTPLPNLDVDFLVNDPALGSVNPISVNTSPSGFASTTFTVNKISGVAEILVRVHYNVEGIPRISDFTVSPQIEIQNPAPDMVYFNTTKEWLVANNVDNCRVIFQAYNQSYPIPNVDVEFSVLEPNMGSFNPVDQITNVNGSAESIFTVLHKSGNATLKAYYKYKIWDIETVKDIQYIQKIDHDTPFNLTSYNAPGEMSVGAVAPIIMEYSDQWGNKIDNRRYIETVDFYVSSPMEDAGFLNESLLYPVVTIPVDIAGKATAWLQASSSPAINVVRVDPNMGSMPEKYFFVQGIANRTPIQITQMVSPEGYMGLPPKQYADGVSLYAFTYILTDQFGNGVMNTPVRISTSISGEERTVYTNSIGQAMVTYGPKSSIGKITVTATSLANTSVSCSKEVWFVSQDAESMQFSIVPDSMPSRDVESWVPGELLAKVLDENGNPVEGETVTFTLGDASYEETYTITDQPEIGNGATNVTAGGSVTAISNEDGYAIGYFYPGGFTPNWLDDHYDETASGTCTVTASWTNGVDKSSTVSLPVSWKNYPYLSIETEVYPTTVNVTDTVDVLVRLKGDGWKLYPKPIDVVLTTDRSGSMLQDEPDDRFVPVMLASKDFTASMTVSLARDHVGLISFGTDGWANLTPTYRYLHGNYYCYSPSGTDHWATRHLDGWYYDWRNVYGIQGSDGHQWSLSTDSSCLWALNDDSWDMTRANNLNYWPFTTTANYNLNNAHQVYVDTHYPGNNRYYGQYAKTEQTLSADSSQINNSIDSMVPAGGTPMRYAIYQAVNEIKTRGRQSAIRAIILLSDGDYNWYGDPLARGTGSDTCNPTSYGTSLNYCKFTGLGSGINSQQNMSNYAKENNIKIYSIAYGSGLSSAGTTTLRVLAESTGGKYYIASSADIGQIYKDIAGDLKTEAGVNTQMNLNFDTIEVNYEPIVINDTFKVFDYVPSTSIDSYFTNMTRPAHSPSYPYQTDQSGEWNGTKHLSFNIGTIYLQQIWEARYKLRVLQDGSINVFGPDSTVVFNNGEVSLNIPRTLITGVPGMVTTGVNSSTLDITIDNPATSDEGIVTWTIRRNYTGAFNVKEDYYISGDGGMTWILVGFQSLTKEEANQDGIFSMPRQLLPPGEVQFKYVGNTLDSPGPVIVFPLLRVPPAPPEGKNYIKLK